MTSMHILAARQAAQDTAHLLASCMQAMGPLDHHAQLDDGAADVGRERAVQLQANRRLPQATAPGPTLISINFSRPEPRPC